MKAKVALPILVALIVTAFLLFTHRTRSPASLLLVNGIVYTVNESLPVAEAIAIRGDRIVGLGTNEQIRASYSAEDIMDLRGQAVYPGFTDSHAHVEELGAMLKNLNVGETQGVDEILRLVAERAKHAVSGTWIRGRGWDQNQWPRKEFPTHQMLDEVAKDVPVYLRRVDGHAAWVNQKALDIAGITKETPDPEGGRIVRDKGGNPTGVFIDNALGLLDSVMPPPTRQERTEAIQRALQECVRVGLTEVHDMGVDLEAIAIYKELISRRQFPLRLYAAIDGLGETWAHYRRQGPDIGGNDGRLTVRALKLYADGALGSRGAALIEPYSDDPGNRGLTLMSSEEMKSASTDALERGFQVCVHAIGDRANHLVLDVYQGVLASNASKAADARFRVEHAQVLDSADIGRFKQLNVYPVMQPTHCTSDMSWAEDRLGRRRARGAYAWRALLDHGSVVPAGSDFPVESPKPLWGVYAAISRQDQRGWPKGGWHPEQRMTREEALKAYTLWPAQAAFEENLRGSLEQGKLADLVVLSKDIMKIEVEQILSTEVTLTMVGGVVVYQSAIPIP